MSASFFGILKNHNHTATVGDGGQLSNLGVSGTLGATGDITSSGGDVSGENVHATAGLMDVTQQASQALQLITLELALALDS